MANYSVPARLTAAASLAQTALFIALVARAAILRPCRDMFSWIGADLERGSNAGWGAYLWQPHNEHHLVLIRLLTAAAVTWCHGNGAPFIVTATVALLATAAMLHAAWRDAPPSSRRFAPLAAMLLLTVPAAADCAIPVNTVYPLALFCIVAALVWFDSASERRRHTAGRRAAACGAALLASLGSGVGLVAIPALLWAAWRSGARRWLIPLAVGAAVYGAFYVHGLPINLAAPAGLGHFAKMAGYATAFAGLPLSRVPFCGFFGRALGAVLIFLGIAILAHDAVTRNDISRLHRISLALIVAGLGATALASTGRVDLSPDIQLPLRYALMAAPLHAGLLGWLVCTRRGIPAWAGGAFAGIILLLQIATAPALVAASDAVSTTLDQFDAGVRTPAMRTVIFPDLATADDIMAELRGRR